MDNSKQQWPSDTIVYEVHRFNMGDVEDPDLWAAASLHDFENSEGGKWIMENSVPTPTWHRTPIEYGWKYHVSAYLTPEQLTFYRLKYE